MDIKDLEDLWRGLMIEAALKGYTTPANIDVASLQNPSEDSGIYYMLFDCTLLQKWLREEHDLHISIDKKVFSDEYTWDCFPAKYTKAEKYHSYEEALIQGLINVLKLIKNETT